ncbi:MAG: antibiotic resistance protein MarC [Bacteroidetes bacterium GWC2_33_15]|nr:MAG: antibiotic resistance protein MarC [Bacteroidetes bacterium GWA2_33_15]OFX51924.1 MAG: antibiotic resistance protein MarC [Bacteroidetes bacterium GWC2_33_15]OFX63492.1 MAG: antibiotic resistance protein MarC [Bacteroidetes bacterium GWB2_32_14]OFX67241.1 MAG: antibiotic resistance protein MarC [Bacteroidetes bacterium GWD2_33_33]HAN17052.1 stress protection protein MarC [Bacteroidales bacterium]
MILFFTVFAALFSVVNPLGTMPVFIGVTETNSRDERNKTALKASVYMFLILSVAYFAGKFIIQFFGISIESLRIAGGLIIASSGFALLTGNFSKHKGMDQKVHEEAVMKEDSSLTPLAIPMLAGPGSISLLISLNENYSTFWETITVFLTIPAVGIVTYLILRSSHYIFSKMGASGLNSVSRIIGFIVIAIGIEYIITSVMALVKQLI